MVQFFLPEETALTSVVAAAALEKDAETELE